MPATTAPTSDEARISDCINGVAQAIRAKYLDALMEHYAPDPVIFDLMPLETLGRDAYRKNFESWFSTVNGPIEFETSDVRIATQEDVAFGHYTSRMRYCSRPNGLVEAGAVEALRRKAR
jgi:ketosteroid isomerase-like protein